MNFTFPFNYKHGKQKGSFPSYFALLFPKSKYASQAAKKLRDVYCGALVNFVRLFISNDQIKTITVPDRHFHIREIAKRLSVSHTTIENQLKQTRYLGSSPVKGNSFNSTH